ncbi:MAG TPA: PhzF family phenazine biosynthesis protein [Steroidobacteraceae bacterium]|nr:PhzF family phenazine biosynthesis protein [Steroidobacteraceae bacterium]
MKYTFHIVDVFSSTPFGGCQIAVLPDATGISTEGTQKIAREFNFGETTFVLGTGTLTFSEKIDGWARLLRLSSPPSYPSSRPR